MKELIQFDIKLSILKNEEQLSVTRSDLKLPTRSKLCS